MYPAAAARIIETVITLPILPAVDGIHFLSVRPLEPGVVFEIVIVDDGGYKRTFFKMPESPSVRQ